MLNANCILSRSEVVNEIRRKDFVKDMQVACVERFFIEPKCKLLGVLNYHVVLLWVW